jgi:hypothetical protein
MAQLFNGATGEVADRAPRLVLTAVSQLVSQDRKIAFMMIRNDHTVPQRYGTSAAGDKNHVSQQT